MGLAARTALWVAVSAVASVLVTGVAILALFVTSWPKWLCLVIEPVSLLLTPGVVASMLFTGKHDYVTQPTLVGNFAFYAMCFLGWQVGRAWIARRRLTSGPR